MTTHKVMSDNKPLSRVLICLTTLVLTAGVWCRAAAQNVVPDNVERAALLALYNSTDGENWGASYRWSLDSINNYPDSYLYGIEIENGDITSISLASAAGLNGTLPAELGNLTELQYLSIQANPPAGRKITGSMPDLGALQKLITMDFYNNDFSGSFPSWLGDLTTLQTLNLSGNANDPARLTGPLPSEISLMVNLRNLNLNNANLGASASIPASFSALDNLETLQIQGCALTTSSVSTGLSGLTSLRYLNLAYNASFKSTAGVFPDVLFDLPNLEQLTLSGINFDFLPGRVAQLPDLRYLTLSGSDYSDTSDDPADTTRLRTIIDTLQNCPVLESLFLGSCGMTALPPNIGTLATVETLYLNQNPLDPAQCEVIGDMPALKNLYVHNCNLGDLPESLTDITTLEVLYAANNQLYPIPDHIKDIPNLRQLNLGNNGIGALPSWFGTGSMGSHLQQLTLSNNAITLPLPADFSLLVSLTYLDLSNNDLQGVLPSYFSGFTQVYYLNLGNNEITSPLPDMSAWSALGYIYLQHNMLTGSVPPYIGNATVPKSVVDLSHNEFDEMTAFNASSSLNLTVNDNNFNFGEILKAATPLGSYAYAPQDTVDQEREVRAFAGGTLTLLAAVDTATTPASRFQWFRYVDGVNDVALFSPPAENAYRYALTVTEADQDNEYYYKITNPAGAPALTLTSRRQHLTVTCNVFPDTITFSTTRYLCAIKFKPLVEYPAGCRTRSYSWDFGDGAASADKSPLHAYGSGGTYDVSMTIQYTCGICVTDTTVTRQVVYSPSDSVLMDSLIYVTTDVRQDVLAVSAATFSDAWPLQPDAGGASANRYLNGTQGVWRNNGAYVYDVPRKKSEAVKISKDGTFDLEHFNWDHADLDAIPHWINAATMTQYSSLSYELENRDVLGVYSAALYDYGGHLPSANGVNMRHKEMAFTGFEFLDQGATGNWMFGQQPLPAQYTYEVYSGHHNIAIVKASLAELADVDKVDVLSRGFRFPLLWRYNRRNFIQDNEIVCRQVFPDNPEWSIVVLRQAPHPGLWKGSVTVKNEVVPVVTPDIDDTMAHSGMSSLTITADKTFRQPLLQLDSGKTYYISAWVSVNNPHVTAPFLAAGLGYDVIVRDGDDNIISTTTYEPAGRIIEGWQQVKGTFVCPIPYAAVELKFRPGSTGAAWYDDLRLHPEKGNMRSYVYNLADYRLQAILDEENFASFFYYDREGNLKLTKKETEEGIKTISENTSYVAERP